MFAEVFRFELRYQLRQPLFWVASFFFFLITFLAITTDAVIIGGSIGQVNRNAPFVVMQMFLVMSLLATFINTAFVAGTVLRDSDHKTRELFFSTRLNKPAYLLGRFLGAFTVACLLYVAVALGIFLGAAMPWLEPERIGPLMPAAYGVSLFFLAIPNTLLTSGLVFGLATRTRSLMLTYAGVIGFFVAYAVAGNLMTDLENEDLGVVLDPFGGAALQFTTKYWTVAERNSRLLEMEGAVLVNRLLWVGLGLALLAWTYWRFSFSVEGKKGKKSVRATESQPGLDRPRVLTPPRVTPRFGGAMAWAQYLRQTRLEMGAVFRSLAFPILVAFGVLNMVVNSTVIDQFFGTPVYPVTHLMISILQGGFLFMFLIVTVYAAELVWRERSLDLDEVHDALPVPNWVLWGGKLTALVAVVLALLGVSILTGIGIQAWRGYFDFEPLLYLQGMFLVAGIPFVLAAVLAFFLQVVSNHKHFGIGLMIVYFISGPTLSAWDFDHNLYNYASAPGSPYSDMNGYGHFVQPLFWFYLYWSLFAVLLIVASHLLWVRGKEGGLRKRIQLARQRWTPRVTAVLATAAVACAATGGWIFYNTNVLNEYVPGDEQELRQVEWETRYKQYEDLPQPRIVAATSEVDIHPYDRAVDIRGTYVLENKTDQPLTELHVALDPVVERRAVTLPATLEHEDEDLGYYVYRFEEPLAPGGTLEMGFDLAVDHEGFVNQGSGRRLVYNGTFFNNFDFFPALGYQSNPELSDPNDRRKHGLPPMRRMPKLDDVGAYGGNYLTRQADWVDFETVVSTVPEQIALAPGYLQREWVEDGRRYFHYAMDAPILGFWSYLSADWELARDSWNDVATEIYHHRGHPYNVQRMIDATKASLEYFTREFGPYQHRQVRIVEFPRYARFAQSFPNTIPFSESIGFIARLDEEDEDAIDYVFYVTAHEVAHQWWAHQVIGANVQGATVLSETMSQYSALMVMKEAYGADHMRRFLKYELDNYLRSRGGELLEELPLMLVENQGYIHYRKGSVVMYALQDLVGEDRLNRAIRAFIDEVAFQEPPYTTTREFLAHLAEAVPAEQEGLLDDLFREITLYENVAEEATWRRRADGKYVVELAVGSQKFRADGEGTETEVPMDAWVDVAVFGEPGEDTPPEGEVLALEKRHVTGPGTLEVVVDEEPRKAGIDPFNILIDRNPENNVVKVEEGAE